MEWLSTLPPPPNFLLWVAVAGFGFEIIRFLVGLVQRSADRRASIVDDFWYRTILVPMCWQPIVDLVTKHAAKLHAIDTNKGPTATAKAIATFAREFALDKNRVIARFQVLMVFSDDAYVQIGEALDAIEDEIAEYAASVEKGKLAGGVVHTSFVESLLWTNLKTVCGHMMKLHPRVKMPK